MMVFSFRCTSLLLAPVVMFMAACGSQQAVQIEDRNVGVRTSATATPSAGGGAVAGGYVVKRGDTLYRIALEQGLDYRDIASWNAIPAPYTIREGQVLRLAPAANESSLVQSKPLGGTALVESRPLDASPVSPSSATNAAVKREPRAGKEPYSEEAYARLSRWMEKTGETPRVAEPPPVVQTPPASPPPAVLATGDDVVWAWPTTARLTSPFSESGSKGFDFAGRAGDPVLAAAEGKVVYAGSGLRGYGELVIVKHNATFLSAYAHNRKILVREGQQVTRGQKIAEMGNTDAESVKLHFEIRKQGKPVDPAQFLPKR